MLPVLRERFVNKKFFQKEPDEAIVKETLEVAIPLAFDYLEGRIDVKVFMIGAEKPPPPRVAARLLFVVRLTCA